MTEKRSLITLSDEQSLFWYQHHVQVLHGYALALALKAGLNPAEAASVFVEPWESSSVSLPSPATPDLLEQQAGQIAEVFALTYGAACVYVERQDATWRIEVTVVDREPLERYGVSLELHAQWMAEQLRHVCEPKGMLCSVWLDPERLSFQLALSIGHEPELRQTE